MGQLNAYNKNMKFRIEHDSLWEKQIPLDALYGIQSLRAKENFQISDILISSEITQAYSILKKCAARVNVKLWKLDADVWKAIEKACDEIIAGKHKEQFIVWMYQAWAGTSTHMNINEVIANRVLEMWGEKKWSYDIISPNDHVNMSQSTNDTYPTMMRLALVSLSWNLIEALWDLEMEFRRKSEEFSDVISSSRTHLQDAVPITLGQEFWAYTQNISSLIDIYKSALQGLKFISIWWSAAGTWINTHPEYHTLMVQSLREETGIDFQPSPDLISGMMSQKEIGVYISSLTQLAQEISKISSDLRLLSSWPFTGINEINLPPVQPWSSIMPWKVNPSILECVNMVCFRVYGSDTSVKHALSESQLNLNVWMPLMLSESLHATKILTNAIDMMAHSCVAGITANKEICETYAYESSGIFTVLNQILWYSKVAEIVKYREASWKSISDVLLEKTDLGEEEIKNILNPNKLTRP